MSNTHDTNHRNNADDSSQNPSKRVRTSGDMWSGEVESDGDPKLIAAFTEALQARGDVHQFTHRFHSHPARLHPKAARILIEALPGNVVFDPFCGGGTMLVEAMLAGRRVFAQDINPVSVMVSRARTRLLKPHQLEMLVEAAHSISKEAQRQCRSGDKPDIPPQVWAMREWYDQQMLLELGWLYTLLLKVKEPALRSLLNAVHSASVIKFSRRASETSIRSVEVQRPPGAACRHFANKASELSKGLGALAEACPEGVRSAYVSRADARDPDLSEPVDLILTSPPYPATYDYLPIQRLRLAWRGIDPDTFSGDEVGTRRGFRTAPRAALDRWRDDTRTWMNAAYRVLRPGGKLVIVIGDGYTEGRAIDTIHFTQGVAHSTGYRDLARVTVERKDEGLQQIRPEHIMAFERLP